MESISKPTVLDCTFRDGGYKNGWQFDDGEVERHVAGTAADVVEIGFRAVPGDGCGAYRYCSDSHLSGLDIPERVRLAVMVNANEWVDGLFQPKDQSRVDIVRVAAHLEALADARIILRELRNLGYFTTLNIMQAHRAENWVFCREYNADVVYFADSFGCLSARQVAQITQRLAFYNGCVGFHGHDNSRRALSNTLVAMRHGATWLDGSVDGIGRGAGNVDLAELLAKLGRSAGSDLADLRRDRTIRSSIVYRAGALLKMHPKRIERWA